MDINDESFNPNQRYAIKDGNKYPETSKENRDATPITHRQESENDISLDTRFGNSWENGSPRKLYRKHFVKSSKSRNGLTQKFKKRSNLSKYNNKKAYASIITEKSELSPSRALTYVPSDKPVEKAFEDEQPNKVDLDTISGTDEYEQRDFTDANKDSKKGEIDNGNSWENSSPSENVESQIGNEKHNDQNDQWIGGLKSRLKDRRVQYKRKQDQIGYRINPSDASSSLIKPSDIHYLNPEQSTEYLDKWKPLNDVKEKQFRKKRFRLY